jgi:hypothetical protein
MYRRLRILESNYGRDGGWYVEVEGRRLAALTDPQYYDMFWDSYRLEPLTTDPAELEMLFSADFWDHCGGITFRSRAFGEVAPNAFPSLLAGAVLQQTGRLVVRGLYLPVPCYCWDWLLLELRRLWHWLNDRRSP